MRKSVKIIIAIFSVMICLLVIISMTLSGTFAKYVTSGGDFSDSARVAKWGVTIDTYSDLVSSYTKDNVILFQTRSNTNDKIIAPGTKGSLLCFEVQGKAEVSYDIALSNASFTLGDGYCASSKILLDEYDEPIEYFPIIIKFCKIDYNNSSNTVIESYGMTGTGAGHEYATVEALETAIAQHIDTAFRESVAPPSDRHVLYSIEWEWPYSAPSGNTYQTQRLDTILGEALIANRTNFNIGLSADISATQTR